MNLLYKRFFMLSKRVLVVAGRHNPGLYFILSSHPLLYQ